MKHLTMEMTLVIVVSITGTTTILGIIALCYVWCSERKRSQDNRQRLNNNNNTVEQSQQQIQTNKPPTDTPNVPKFTFPKNNKNSSINKSNSDVRKQQNNKVSSSNNSPIETLSSSYDDDAYADGNNSVMNYPVIRRFSSSSSGNLDEITNDEDSLDIRTFDDNWSYAMV